MNESTSTPENLDSSKLDPTNTAQEDRVSAAQSHHNRSTQVDSGDSDASGGDTMSASHEIATLKKERDELRDQALRVRAEFANFQKRSKQQVDSDRVYAAGSLARDLLDPLDNFERAIEALRASGHEGISAGLEMVRKQLIETLGKHGVEPIAALGLPFDPNVHEAISQQPSHEHPEGTIVAEHGKGYKIADRVLRPTKVAVSVTPPAN